MQRAYAASRTVHRAATSLSRSTRSVPDGRMTLTARHLRLCNVHRPEQDRCARHPHLLTPDLTPHTSFSTATSPQRQILHSLVLFSPHQGIPALLKAHKVELP